MESTTLLGLLCGVMLAEAPLLILTGAWIYHVGGRRATPIPPIVEWIRRAANRDEPEAAPDDAPKPKHYPQPKL